MRGEDIIKECTKLQIEAFAFTGSKQANHAFQALLIAAIDNLTSEVRDLKKCLTVPDYNDRATWEQAQVQLYSTDRQEQN